MEEKKLTRISLVPAREEGKAHRENRDGLRWCGMVPRCAVSDLVTIKLNKFNCLFYSFVIK